MEIRAQFTEALILRATRRFWVRLIAWHGFAVIGLGLAAVVCLLVLDGPSTLVLSFAAVLVLAVIVGSAVYFIYRNRALSVFRQMRSPEVVFQLTDEGVSTRSGLGGGDMAWRGITKVWVFPEVWLLFVAKGMYFTIPTGALSPEAQGFIRAKVSEHGGRVV